MPATLRDLFYCRYDPMEAAEPNRPEYNAIYEELEQVEGELRKALGEEGREKLRRKETKKDFFSAEGHGKGPLSVRVQQKAGGPPLIKEGYIYGKLYG